MLDKAQASATAAQEETKRQAIMYERSIKKLHQEIELAKVDEEQRQRNIVKVGDVSVMRFMFLLIAHTTGMTHTMNSN